MDQQEIENAADVVSSFLNNACGDLGYEQAKMFKETRDGWLVGENAKKVLTEMEKGGVRDLEGAYADHLYNDVDTLHDFMGDRIHDEVKGNNEDFVKVLKEMRKCAHPAMVKAIDQHLKRKEK